jgi:hypothetical protein
MIALTAGCRCVVSSTRSTDLNVTRVGFSLDALGGLHLTNSQQREPVHVEKEEAPFVGEELGYNTRNRTEKKTSMSADQRQLSR